MRSDPKLGTVVSTTDLLKFLSCEELSVLDLLRSQGLAAPVGLSHAQQLAAKKGLLSEADVLAILQDRYGEVVKISGRDRNAHRETLAAMRSGAKLIYQGLILTETGGFLYESRPDFLVKVDHRSMLGAHSYEPVDSKLSKTTKLDDLLQILDYADALYNVQGVLPRRVHLFLAGIEQVSYRTEAYIEEVRLQKERFLRFVAGSKSFSPGGDLFAKLDPKPNNRCVVCDWSNSCGEYWERSDSLYRVANIAKSQVARLNEVGINSLTQLANQSSKEIRLNIQTDVLETLIAQAGAQLKTIESGSAKPYFEIRSDAYLKAQAGKGLGLIPKPSEGDVFFDIEGDPFYKPDGLEYLFGVAFLDNGVMKFKAFWGTDPENERKAFGELIEFIMERWERFPDFHIYHYADYERSAISKLASRCNYKVFEIDSILRNDLLVDLFPVVRGTILLGADSYSLKKVEKLYLPEARHESVTTAMGSVETFEAWLGSGDFELLEEIERYNEVDVRSTGQLRDFLLSIRNELSSSQGELPYRGESEAVQAAREKSEREIELERLELALLLKAESTQSPTERSAYQLCSDLLGFHNREDKPTWWRYFNLISPERDVQDYFSEPGCIGGLVKHSEYSDDQGAVHVTYSFDPRQPFKINDEKLLDPQIEYEYYRNPENNTGKVPVGTQTRVDYARGLIEIRRNQKYPLERDPQNLIAWNRVSAEVIEKALRRFAKFLIDTEDLSKVYDAGIEILKIAKPRFSFEGQTYAGIKSLLRGLGRLDTGDVTETAIRLSELLDCSYLVIQGPPGAGKTFLSAKMISHLVRGGKKVFVTALSHSAVDNVIEALVPMLNDPQLLLRVESPKARKMDGVTYIKSADIGFHLHQESGVVVGGTVWNGAKEELAKGFDYAFVDEAGQFSLANAIALTTNCCNLVLTGDPQQLSQPVTGSHPFGAASSVLEHLVGDRDVVDDDFGLFLPKTFRMHPRLSGVVSAVSYDSKLSSASDLDQLELVDPAPLPKHGLVYIPVEHKGNTYRSQEETDVARRVAQFLLERSWIDKKGDRCPITPDQIMVVAPYNAQTNSLKSALAGLATVGTVDKFQGREAPFVIISLSASDGESSSRGVDFLFSTNRLNVAISRAKVMSIILASPALLETKPATIGQLELLGAVTKVIKASEKVDFNHIR